MSTVDESGAMPADTAAERYVLAAAVHSAGRTLTIGNLTPDDFHEPKHAQLFRALQHRANAGEPIEPTALLPVVGDIRGIDASWLVKLLELSALPGSVGYYAGIIQDRATARAIIAAGERAIKVGYQAPESADILDEANAACDMITRAAQRSTAVSTGDLAADLDEFLDSLAAPDEFTPTPWPDLDRFIGGWAPGCMYVIGARPGCGKSVIGMCAALHAAARGSLAFFASVEMSKRELYRRMVANVGKIDHDRLVRKALSDDDWASAARARAVLGEMRLKVADDVQRPAEIIGRAQAIARENGPLGLLVVDYLQLMRDPTGGKSNRQEVVSEFSRSLKLAAKALNVPLIALSQLNRGPEQRTEKRPMISDLRESGSLEQDADVVILLHREIDEAPDILSAAVAKNRHGLTGSFDLAFQGRYQRISSLERRLEVVQ